MVKNIWQSSTRFRKSKVSIGFLQGLENILHFNKTLQQGLEIILHFNNPKVFLTPKFSVRGLPLFPSFIHCLCHQLFFFLLLITCTLIQIFWNNSCVTLWLTYNLHKAGNMSLFTISCFIIGRLPGETRKIRILCKIWLISVIQFK